LDPCRLARQVKQFDRLTTPHASHARPLPARPEYGLANARTIRATLTDNAVARLKKALSDPRNFGPAKSLVMAGMEAGFDMTTPEGAHAFQAVYNANIVANRLGGLPPGPGLLGGGGSDPLWIELPPPRKIDRETKRKQRKAQRQARKRNRR
jgi:hypothetical protein